MLRRWIARPNRVLSCSEIKVLSMTSHFVMSFLISGTLLSCLSSWLEQQAQSLGLLSFLCLAMGLACSFRAGSALSYLAKFGLSLLVCKTSTFIPHPFTLAFVFNGAASWMSFWNFATWWRRFYFFQELCRFFRVDQGEPDMDVESAIALIQKYEPDSERRSANEMTIYGFTNMLLSQVGDIFKEQHKQVGGY